MARKKQKLVPPVIPATATEEEAEALTQAYIDAEVEQAINERRSADPDPAEEAAEAEIEEQIALPRSVVKPTYKVRYRDRAREAGLRGKAAKRSTWDWLAQEIAAECLTKEAKLKVDDFLALLTANGVDHSRWTNRSKGWEGRLRMTGRLALQRVVAETGILHFPDGENKEAPEAWIAKHLH